MKLVKASGIINDSGDASNNLMYYCDNLGEWSRTILKSITWSDAFRGVGQMFEVEAVEFSEKLIIYYVETGYKFKFVQNDSSRVIVEFIKKKDTGYKWRIHASTILEMNEFFIIKKIENNHTCSVACKDIRNHRFTSKLIKKLIHDEI